MTVPTSDWVMAVSVPPFAIRKTMDARIGVPSTNSIRQCQTVAAPRYDRVRPNPAARGSRQDCRIADVGPPSTEGANAQKRKPTSRVPRGYSRETVGRAVLRNGFRIETALSVAGAIAKCSEQIATRRCRGSRACYECAHSSALAPVSALTRASSAASSRAPPENTMAPSSST